VKQSLKKHLVNVFLSALVYNASATIKLMEMQNVSKGILSDVLALKKLYKCTYE